VQKKIAILGMGILVDVIHTGGIEERRTALDAVNFVSLFKQKFREVRAILAGNACNERYFLHCSLAADPIMYLLTLSGATSSPSGQLSTPCSSNETMRK
jgi:hypothetical protein